MSVNGVPMKTEQRRNRENEALLLTICVDLQAILTDALDLQIALLNLDSPEQAQQLGAINRKLRELIDGIKQMADEFHELGFPVNQEQK